MELLPISSSQKKYYLRNDGDVATFQNDSNLPKLPVPTLELTLRRYLSSVEPLVSSEEYLHARKFVEEFLIDGSGNCLQSLLVKKMKNENSWIDEWWLRYAYLKFRSPLMPLLNTAGPFGSNNPGGAWPVPVENGEHFKYVSHFVYQLMLFWKALRTQQLRADESKSGTKFSMHQFRKLFNTTRIPMTGEDRIQALWQTEDEGSVPTHAIAMRNGHIFRFEPINDATGLPRSTTEIEWMLRKVCELADSQPEGPGIGALTRDFRDTWADNRHYLMSLGPLNRKSLDTIETAMMVVVLDKAAPKSDSECCSLIMAGDPSNRWADKSLSVIVFENGRGGVNSDHSPMDAMVNVVMSHWIDLGVSETFKEASKWEERANNNAPSKPHLLPWIVDDNLRKAIQAATNVAKDYGDNLIVRRKPFLSFGKDALTKVKVNPDTFVQMAIQLAYYRLHKKPGATYETATTRKFRHGRTETVRSCSKELVEFCKLMTCNKPMTSISEKKASLTAAIKKHNELMSAAKNGQGCDRHLFALYTAALEEGLPIPRLFEDPCFEKSGGNGNFVLSTSTCGYTGMSGGTAAMCTDGYGCFYNFESKKIWLWITAFRKSYETSVEKFTHKLEAALLELHDLLNSNQSSSKL